MPWFRLPSLSLTLVLAASLVGCGLGKDEPSEPSSAEADGPGIPGPEPAAAASQAPAPVIPERRSRSGPARHALVILVDTLRADAVQAANTPQLDALAARGLVAERAWSTSTWTVPAVISLFTGSFVRTHGWDLPTGDMEKRPALPALPTLAEVLQREGFSTQGLYANGYLAHELGFHRGFDEWRRCSDSRMAREVGERVEGWQLADEQPGVEAGRHFLYVHLLGGHSGLRPSESARGRYELEQAWFEERTGLLIGRAKRGREEGVRDAYRRAYHAVVEDVDSILGEIFAAVEPVLDDTLVVVVSDHGEELGELDVFGHGWSVAEALTHVPFVAAGPGIEPGSRRATASLAEVGDLVTDGLGVDHDWPVQSPWQGPLAAERHGKQAILVGGRWKGTWHGEDLATYDLQSDAAALRPVPGGTEQLERGLERWRELVPEGQPLSGSVELDQRTVDAIRALGYID